MLPIAALIAVAGPTFSKPTPWALNFAAPGDFCMVGDIDGDGYADLIRVSPTGDSFIDIAINVQGMKSRVPQRANSNWGKDCQAACSGDFDDTPGVDVVGLFDGDTLRLAHAFKDGAFKDEPSWLKLPGKLEHPRVQWDASDHLLSLWDAVSGHGYAVSLPAKGVKEIRLPPDTTWADLGGDGLVKGPNGSAFLTDPPPRYRMTSNGSVWRFGSGKDSPVGKMRKGNSPLVGSGVFVDEPLPAQQSSTFSSAFPSSLLPECPCTWATGDIDHDGAQDLIQFRFGSEPHTGHDVLLYRQPAPVGGSNASGTATPAIPNMDSSGDGILDDWKLNGFRGLDLKALGCVPGQKDIIVLISRHSTVDKGMVESTFKNIEGYYLSLGWHLHPVFLDPLGEADQKLPWWQLRDKFLPAKWRGVAHYMAVSPYGGGQADELSDGGGCGGNGWSLYATFIHEFGHQLGLNHEGFYPTTGCPIYSSMMNYPYSYTFEGNIKNIHYSDGSLKDYVLHETDLDETIPLPFEKVKFLAAAPYHFRLKPNGKTTLIDWNWNGIFGEKHVRADINYAYSTSAGRRDDVGKTNSAPWTFTHGTSAYVLYAQESVKPDGASAPSVGPDKPGWLMLRRLIKPFKWADPQKIVNEGVTGDPVAISYNDEIVVAYPSSKGLAVRWLQPSGDKVAVSEPTMADESNAVPSLGVYQGTLFLFEWSPNDGSVKYRTLSKGHTFGDLNALLASGESSGLVSSTEPVSMAVDTIKDEILIGTAENQSASKPGRWAIRHEKLRGEYLRPMPLKQDGNNRDREWVEGDAGNVTGSSRCVLLFDENGATGMRGRLVYYMLGSTNSKTPWACVYMAQSIADKTVRGGWQVRRYYDEWTQSRSAPAACWFNGDILYAYRWVDGGQGSGDNVLHVGYNGTGIESAPMGDFDDIGFIRDFGMQNSILYLRQ